MKILVLTAMLVIAALPNVAESRAFSSNEERVLQAYLAYYGRPADPGGLEYWSDRLRDEGGDLSSIIDEFGESEEYQQRFGSLENTQLVTNLYHQLFGRDPDSEGLNFYVEKLESGVWNLQKISLVILDGVQGDDITIVNNRLSFSEYFVAESEDGSISSVSAEELAELVAGIGASQASLDLAYQDFASRYGSANPTLHLSFMPVKTFKFSWNGVSNADHYNLMENPDGLSGFTQVATVAADTSSFSHVVPLYARLSAEYILETCYSEDDSECAASNIVLVSGTLADSIGYFKASNTESADYFSHSVELSGDGNTLAVSTWGEDSDATGVGGDQTNNRLPNSGAVYVFTRSGSSWSQQAYIKASNTGIDDHFGISVTLSSDGSTLAVGANWEDSNATGIDGDQTDNSESSAGAAYVYTRSGNNWSQQAYIKASNSGKNDQFGRDVALSGDGNTLAVGAPFEESSATGVNGDQADNSLDGSGAVYLFTRSGDTWLQQAYIKAGMTEGREEFGYAVCLSDNGNTLAAGASKEDGSGAAYVYSRSGTTWSQQAHIKSSNSERGDIFGWALALSGDGNSLAAGALYEDSNATGIDGDQTDNSESSARAGAAYVYTRSGNSWSQQAYIKASNTEGDDEFGFAVDLNSDGNTLAVGAWHESSNAVGIDGDQTENSAERSGAVYVFTRSGGSWLQQGYIKASNTGVNDQFGRAVALSADGSTLAVGADHEDSNATGIGGDQINDSASSAGAVYVY